MNRIVMPLGFDRFEEIRREGYYYIDKTLLIEELLCKPFEVNLFTRPRRFGKTLAMSMLANFFDISKDTREIFRGLAVAENEKLCREWQNQWPVIFLTLKDVDDLKPENAKEKLAICISDLYRQYDYLLKSSLLGEDDKEMFEKCRNAKASEVQLQNSLYFLTRLLDMHYGRPVILLIDEYDVPLAKASENGFYEEMHSMIRGLMNRTLKTNPFLKFAVITGCLRIAKESIFTGMNNLVVHTITEPRFSEYFGFTKKEVARLLRDTGFEDHAEETRRWYDGYLFGETEIYCPWDVLNHVNAIQDNPRTSPKSYWENTSHNGILHTFIELANSSERLELDVNGKFETLLAGGCIEEEIEENLLLFPPLQVANVTTLRDAQKCCFRSISRRGSRDFCAKRTEITSRDSEGVNYNENLTCDAIHSFEKNLWSLLYMTGYLTLASPADSPERTEEKTGRVLLRIPNEEIRVIFQKTVRNWFQESMAAADRSELFDAMWDGDDSKATELISDLLFSTISYYDYKEDFYHAFMAGIFTGGGYAVTSNREWGYGRPDIVVHDRVKRRVMILEVKRVNRESGLEAGCREAAEQIDDRRYADEFRKGYRSVICYGAAFFEKQCLIRKLGEKKKGG